MGVRLRRLRPRPPGLRRRRRARADRLGRHDRGHPDVVGGDAAVSDRAAWVMPVPSAGSRHAWRRRGVRGTRQAHRAAHRVPRLMVADDSPGCVWAGAAPDTAGAPAGAVNVLGRQRIGPFDVTRLAADDPAALATWLKDNGFPHPDGLDENLAPYVADGWEIVAIQLVPAEAGELADGRAAAVAPVVRLRHRRLPDAPVALGDDAADVDLYVLADASDGSDGRSRRRRQADPGVRRAHRAQRRPPRWPTTSVTRAFLTRLEEPRSSTRQRSTATTCSSRRRGYPFQQVIYRTRDRGDITYLILVASIGSPAW